VTDAKTIAREKTPGRAAYFVSDSTGITAETLGSALLANFPGVRFQRHTIPFVDTVNGARNVVSDIERAASVGADPIVFATVKSAEILDELTRSQAVVIDLLGGHLRELEAALGSTASEQLGQYHGVGDIEQYFARMRAVEYAIEHDDGQSLRALDRAEVILVAPSRCGKTPTTMYLALQHGLFVANYPLLDEDLESTALPRPLTDLGDRCFGLIATPARLSEVRQQRRPNSTYASLEQCTKELRRADALYRAHGIPVINSTTRSVEEMSTQILQTLGTRPSRERSRT